MQNLGLVHHAFFFGLMVIVCIRRMAGNADSGYVVDVGVYSFLTWQSQNCMIHNLQYMCNCQTECHMCVHYFMLSDATV